MVELKGGEHGREARCHRIAGVTFETQAKEEPTVTKTQESPVYVSRVRIERREGPVRLAHLPAEEEPVVFGVHSEVAEHYKVPPDKFPPRATTLDYVVAAAAG